MKSKRIQALILAAAVAAGYAGAAAYSAWAMPSVPVVTDFGPGDGLTRYVLTASTGDAAGLLPTLESTAGIVNAQRLSDGRALVATEGLAPQNLEVLPGVADAEFFPSVPVLGTLTDPYGTVLGRTYAAPLLVGTAVTTPSTPGTPGTGTPGTGTPGASTPGTGTPGTGTPGTGTIPPGTGGTGTPGTGADPGPGPDGSGSGGTGDGSGTPGTGTPSTGTPGTGTPDTGSGSGGGGAPAPEVGGSVTFPGSGPFGITSISPATVDIAGGTVVTISGTALPANPRVRVGDSATATVVTSSPTGLTFRAPARVAGTYDVHVFATDGIEDVHTAALTYVEGAGAGTPGTPGTGTPGTGTPDTGTPGTPGTPGTGGGAGGSGPGGERLVRTTKFAALGAIWSMDCSASCGGVAI